MIAEGFLRAGAKVYNSSRKPAVCIETAERLSVYRPWDLFPWWYHYEAYAPHVFDKAGAGERECL